MDELSHAASNATISATKKFSMAFYNVENLFDIEDDPHTMDDDFTEKAHRRWNEDRFKKKVKKIGRVISSIGLTDIEHPPVLIGLAEVENKFVLDKLVESKFLKKKNYGIVHFDSPDERGIDTALLYRKDYITIEQSQAHRVDLENVGDRQDYTRDILHVTATLVEETFHVLVNHFPSRRAGVEETEPKRLLVAAQNRSIIDQIRQDDPLARILIMGDFNDDPKSASMQHLAHTDFYNPMELLLTHAEGSLSYKGTWNLFDQLLVSHDFMQLHGNKFRFQEAHIFNPEVLRAYKGRNKGTPFRTYAGRKYLGGTSDHFPIYGIFSIDPS